MQAVLIVASLMLTTGNVNAYTKTEADACYGDAVRLCSPEMKLPSLLSYFAVRLCMLSHRNQVSPKCAAVFRAHGL